MNRVRACLQLLLLLVVAAPAQALSELRVERVRAGAVAAREVALTLAPGAFELEAAEASIEGLAYAPRRLRWRCALAATDAGWRCAGPAGARFGKQRGSASLQIAHGASGTTAALERGSGERITLALGPRVPAELVLERVPLAWLGPLLAPLRDDVVLGAGRLDARFAFASLDPLAARGQLHLDGASFDSADGSLAASGLGARIDTAFGGSAAARSVRIDAKLERGAWLVAPLFVEIGERPIAFALDLTATADGYDIGTWRWDDPESLVAAGTARLGPGGAVQRVAVESLAATLARAYPRYAAGALADTAFGKLDAAGSLRGKVDYVRGAPAGGVVELEGVTLHDRDGRFAIDALTGRLPLAPAQPTAASLAWRAASIGSIPIAAGEIALTVAADRHSLRAPLELGLLEGRARITSFEWVRDPETRIAAALELEQLSVEALTQALGWPRFGGRLSGTIPALRGSGDRIDFDGGLVFDVFDGRIDVAALALERPFGVAPSVAADVVIDDLDLEALTSAFSFGIIEGRLDGRVAGLRLLDGAPVAFDLALETDPKFKGRRRISQRAVDALSTVGGAGAAAGIQRGMLGMFESFRYAAIGLECRLRDNVCEMGGLDSVGDGYTIVRGAGLPRLTVIGHQRRVDWPVLVARLEAATRGTGPVVE